MTGAANANIAGTEAVELGLAPGRYVRLAVVDSGCGIDPDTLNHVWEPYFTTKPPGQGNGLGLATVHGIAHQAGGTVAISSQPGAGTTVEVYLPGADGSEQEHRTAGNGPPKRAKIVLVEPESATRDAIAGTLDRAGYELFPVPDASLALRLLANGHRPDLLVTGVIMPGAWGDEIAAQAREIHPDIRVLYMAGHAERYLGRPRATTADATLTKPFGEDALLDAVDSLLAGPGDALAA